MIIKMNRKSWLVIGVVVLIAVGFYMYNQDVVDFQPFNPGHLRPAGPSPLDRKLEPNYQLH